MGKGITVPHHIFQRRQRPNDSKFHPKSTEIFYKILLCVLLSVTLVLGSPTYTVFFHESHPPLLSRWSSVTEICYIKENKCCVPFDLFDDTPVVYRFRRPLFVAYAVVTKDPGPGSSPAIDPSHDFSVWDYPDEACRGDAVERLREPVSRVMTRTYGADGISAVALGDPGPDPDSSHAIQFPDLVVIEGVNYPFHMDTDQGSRFVKESGSSRADLPGYVWGRPFFNV